MSRILVWALVVTGSFLATVTIILSPFFFVGG